MDVQAAVLHVNLDKIADMVGVAVRRASAFMRLGLDDLDVRGNGDFNLKSELNYVFWPEYISDQDRAHVKEEYKSWVTGCCLRELDQIYGLFLDQVWYVLEVGELHGKSVSLDHVFDVKFSKKTNVAIKQQMVSERLGIPDYCEELNSISLARNALTHNAGFVRTPTDCNAEDRTELHVKWIAFEMLRARDGIELPLFSNGPVGDGLPGEGDVSVLAKVVQRLFIIPAGQVIRFNNGHLAELCGFYLRVRDTTRQAVFAYAKAKGVEHTETEVVPNAPIVDGMD